MTAVPLPKPSSQSPDDHSDASSEVTPVFALKELVARLHREQHKIQDLLSSLGFALRSFNNLNQFLELIPLMATRVTDADGSALVLVKPNGQVRLEQLHCQDSLQGAEIRKAIEAATNKLRNAQPKTSQSSSALAQIDFSDASGHERGLTLLDEHVTRYLGPDIHLFGTAILVKQAERGRLYVFSRDPEYTWTETRQKLVRLVADQTAVAIANDELTVELRKKERLDRELEIGAEIQQRLLPRQCPTIPGIELAARCQPANRVGGDYYDFIATETSTNNHEQSVLSSEFKPDPLISNSQLTTHYSQKGRLGIVIGDVMGKGVPAGLLMTMTRGMLRAEVLNGHSPSRILQHLNQVMYADLENSHRFVTLFYSEYNLQSRILSYSNAAHNPPLLWQASTRSVMRLDTLGMLIGLDSNSQYEEAQVQLAPGDTLIYYTDGFTEAANPSGDRFDEENLILAFERACQHCQGSQAILDYLFDRVQQFIGPGNRNGDDMTLVVMQIAHNHI
ncbi:SpoIIE family protein phosphatase [Planktothrix sp. FACHB-1355]|uniref:SpoIIE family protein phosphatase n=1 Tax=Aerosakkonema funiforme FACHB-1375 TaxID=2949571 RepID=A0A926VGH8_9CYAN|nr:MULTISPECIES: GAF domain-containing SpoIIE family protein phosphatase [Oscillatoriales]MBD2182219.1 SpoIIE family protein phosphatase [Aerosakkonema funiforme FACHB-1375]MBD3558887.1 SpoIIE family protein phosphatase [Planktothrix sp. FACHB-1355]